MRPARVELTPFVAFAGHDFSLSPARALQRLGPPLRRHRNEIGLNEHDHGSFVLRFQDSGRLEEITAQAPVLHLGRVAVAFAHLESFVREQDPAAFWRARFLVSPGFGLAFDPGEPHWVTALAPHCLPQWQAL